MFHIAAFSRIDIQGFIACDKEDAGEKYMNRPVIAAEQAALENSIILVSDKISWVKTLSSHKEYCSGVHSDESLYFLGVRNERLLKVIAEFYGAKLFPFLQPMNVTMSSMSVREKVCMDNEGLS